MHNRVTIVDIGSGSMKASVFERIGDEVQIISGISRGFRLCTKIGADISARKIKVTVDFLTRVAELSKANESQTIVAIATQAARKASNFHALRDEVMKKIGIEVGVISGVTEAKLMAESVKKNMRLNKFISLDLGCGSVEVAEFDSALLGTWSLPISSLDLSQMKSFGAAKSTVRDSLRSLKFHGADSSKFPLIGGGGTLRVARLLINGDTHDTLHYDKIVDLLGTLRGKTPEECVDYGVPKIRCDIFPFGLLIVLGVMEHVGAKMISLTSGNLRMSLALSHFGLL
ncbi:MAG: hypothetical protein LBT64_00540 [Puniceicoccales bacterium]|jgi:exopolyphosphatase/guanosine-5'-triphosphate,3'-diphosphate pyrophosphatase|nr:hypothetical protein [Puniceicoccales bacterium]